MNPGSIPNIGDPMDRIEGREKVTGQATYAAEYKPEGLVYGVLVTSSIAKGNILSIDSKSAESAPGVLAVLSHLNRPQVPAWDQPTDQKGDTRLEGQYFRVFFDDKILYNHQPVALVIADSLERAQHAAEMVHIRYHSEPHQTELKDNPSNTIQPARVKDYQRGTPKAFQTAPVKIEVEYRTSIQVHNPMEMHAATAFWEGEDKVTVYNKSQAVKMAQKEIVTAFRLKEENVTVQSTYVGGAFGSSSRVWPQEMAAILGAKKVGKPVVVMASRQQVFNMVGYRPASVQKIGLGATPDGKLTGTSHEAYGITSVYEQFTERITDPTQSMYACPNLDAVYRLVPLDMSTPAWARGPGETSGSFALESAMDELSYVLKMDPLELRRRNFAENDPANGKPWSSNYLKECYQKGAERFGWQKRKPEPGSMRSGEWLVGMGMSAGIYKADRAPANASATLRPDGTLVVQTSVADVGPGSATIMTQIAADAFHIDSRRVEFQWGRSTYPMAPGQFGSHTTASTGSAVYDAVKALQQRLKELAVNTKECPFFGRKTDDLSVEGDNILIKNEGISILAQTILKRNHLEELKVTKESKGGSETEQFSGKSFCAHFVEVMVHPATGVLKVTRVVSAIDAGKVINYKTATSQVYGAVTWGIGFALMEEGIIDHRYGRYVNNNLADYHVPVNADIPHIEVLFIDQPDPVISPIGAKGLGEIGIVGFSAAVANSVYHATGKRFRSLPIKIDKLV